MYITTQVSEDLLIGKYVHNNSHYRPFMYIQVHMYVTTQVIETLLRGKYVHNLPSYINFTQR